MPQAKKMKSAEGCKEVSTSSSEQDAMKSKASSVPVSVSARSNETELLLTDSLRPKSSEDRRSTECNAECCMKKGLDAPFQTLNQHVLRQTRRLQGNKWRQFSPEWYRVYPWLVLCVTTLKAFCHCCRYCYQKGMLLDKYTDAAFVREGFDNWKRGHERFQRHAQSHSHRESVMKIAQMQQPGIDA